MDRTYGHRHRSMCRASQTWNNRSATMKMPSASSSSARTIFLVVLFIFYLFNWQTWVGQQTACTLALQASSYRGKCGCGGGGKVGRVFSRRDGTPMKREKLLFVKWVCQHKACASQNQTKARYRYTYKYEYEYWYKQVSLTQCPNR